MTGSIDYTIAQALADAGIAVATCVPGTGCCSIFEAFHKLRGQRFFYSYHEEVAYTIAHGAGLAGQRAVTVIKTHGFAKAMNSVLDSLSAGTTAGFLILICDDPEGTHSDNILDSKRLLQGTEIPYHIPDMKNIYDEILRALCQSEKLHLPMALLLNSNDFSRQVNFKQLVLPKPNCSFQKNICQHVLCPLTGRFQRRILELKLSGKPWEHLEPDEKITFDTLPGHYRHPLLPWTAFFEIFKNIRGSIVTGETGLSSLFAFPPFHCIDIVTFMGGSIALAAGIFLAGVQDVWAVTGDFSFIAAGHMGLYEALQRKIPLKVIICDNGKAQATGGQPVADFAISHILNSYRKFILTIKNPQDREEIQFILKKAQKSQQMQIVVVDFKQTMDAR